MFPNGWIIWGPGWLAVQGAPGFPNALGSMAAPSAERSWTEQNGRRLLLVEAVLPITSLVRESVCRVRRRSGEIAEVPELQDGSEVVDQRLQVHWDEHGAIVGGISPVDVRGADEAGAVPSVL